MLLFFYLFLSATCVKGIGIKKVNKLKSIEVDGVKNILGARPTTLFGRFDRK